ncbi:HalOD1 output domain-containing protein [Natrinema salifodinae]|nr:HalOD1 output domain-containing protein [Natrinema salifodinae]
MTMNSADAVSVETLSYDPTTETYRMAYNPATTAPSLAVITALESLPDDALDRGESLYEAIDPDALDRVLTPSELRARPSRRSIEFVHRGVRITVSSRGSLEIRPARDGDRETGP